MRVRALAAAAVAAWSKTAVATTAAVLPGVLEQPAGASVRSSVSDATSCPGPAWVDPGKTGSPALNVEVGYKSISNNCIPGTLSMQASSDGTHWKTLASEHETTATFLTFVDHACLPGPWDYRGFYVTDDHTFKGTSPVSHFTC